MSVLTLNQQALTAEVIKTIRDIISLNPLYKEFLAQLVEGGKRVADNPVHLADFGREAAGFYGSLGCFVVNLLKRMQFFYVYLRCCTH